MKIISNNLMFEIIFFGFMFILFVEIIIILKKGMIINMNIVLARLKNVIADALNGGAKTMTESEAYKLASDLGLEHVAGIELNAEGTDNCEVILHGDKNYQNDAWSVDNSKDFLDALNTVESAKQAIYDKLDAYAKATFGSDKKFAIVEHGFGKTTTENLNFFTRFVEERNGMMVSKQVTPYQIQYCAMLIDGDGLYAKGTPSFQKPRVSKQWWNEDCTEPVDFDENPQQEINKDSIDKASKGLRKALDVIGRACVIKDSSKYSNEELDFAKELDSARVKAQNNIDNMVKQAEGKADNMKQIVTDMQSMAQKIMDAKGNGSGKVLKHLFKNGDAVLNTLDAIASYSY